MLHHTLNLSLDNDRHLVVGDIHGRYDLFMQLLEIAKYDPTKDIIYSVGDIIDRGSQSVEMIQFFQQERCYTIQGNHELMCRSKDWYAVWLANGGLECMDSLRNHNLTDKWLKDQVRDLPYVIDVGEDDEDHAFRIIHAEMPYAWSDAYLKKTLNEAMNPHDPTFSHILWSRTTVEAAQANIEDFKPNHYDLSFHPQRCRTYFSGHTPVKQAMLVKDNWFLDTWIGGTMTMMDAVTKEKFTITF